MLARGMANKEIQFYFNRQDRAVNSGRISGIKHRDYGPEVPKASDDTLSTFLSNFVSPEPSVPSIVIETAPAQPQDAMDEKQLRSFFTKDAGGTWHCSVGETDEFECKQNFNLNGFSKPLRTIAGLANNRGGYLFFGVKDMPDNFAVCGLADDRFTNTDQSKFSQIIRSVLEPTPRFCVKTLKLDEHTVGVIHIEPHTAKPVIACKTEGSFVAEGAIYFRYPGETRAICYADLRTILDERDRSSREAVLPMVQRLLELGPKDAMVANLADGQLEGGQRPIMIDQQLIEKIKFIRDGEFEEKEGAATLRLVGDVNTADLSAVTNTKTVRTEVTEESIIRNFVMRTTVEEPLAYVRQASHEQSFLLPIFYYLQLAGQGRNEAISDLQSYRNAKPNTRKEIIRRLKGERSLFRQAGGQRLLMLNQIREQAIDKIDTIEVAKAVLDALTGLKTDDAGIFNYANSLVIQALEFWDMDRSLVGGIRKAASRLDELIYGSQVSD